MSHNSVLTLSGFLETHVVTHIFHVNYQPALLYNKIPLVQLHSSFHNSSEANQPHNQFLVSRVLEYRQSSTFCCVYALTALNREETQLVPSLTAGFPSHYEHLTSNCFPVTYTSAPQNPLALYLCHRALIDRNMEQMESSWRHSNVWYHTTPSLRTKNFRHGHLFVCLFVRSFTIL